MTKPVLAILAASGMVILVGCQSNPLSSLGKSAGKQAAATLEAKSGSKVAGRVNFTERGDKVLVTARLSGLKPNSEHGFHVHEKGDCSAADATSAGGHFNPDGQPHNHPSQSMRHAGDMNNLVANARGEADVSFEMSIIRIDDGKYGILNRAVVVHADPDDYKSQPAGNSGSRIACGVIKKA